MNKHIGLFIPATVSLLPVSAQSQTAKDIEGCWSLTSFVIERLERFFTGRRLLQGSCLSAEERYGRR